MKVDPKQVKDAVQALYAYIAKTKEANESKLTLWEEDSDISLMFALVRTPDKERNKPFRIPLKHSLYHRSGVEICLLTADPQSQYKEILAKHPVENITKVIGINKLRHKYIPYKDKRTLLNTYQVFMADRRITNLLPPLLGQKFFQKKKQPIPVKLDLTDANIVKELTAARDSTYLFIKTGPCCAVRIAKTSFTQQQVEENILFALENIIKNLPKKWKGLQAIYLKTHDSVSLPLYNSLPEVDTKISVNPRPLESLKKSKKRKRSAKKEEERKHLQDAKKLASEAKQQKFQTSKKERKKEKKSKRKIAAK